MAIHVGHSAILETIVHPDNIRFRVVAHFAQRISSEFFGRCIGQHQRHHSLGNHSHRRNSGGIGALRLRFFSQSRFEIHSLQGPPQRRDWLHCSSQDERLTCGHPTLESARSIGRSHEPAARFAIASENLVVHFGSTVSSGVEACADLDGFLNETAETMGIKYVMMKWSFYGALAFAGATWFLNLT